MLPVTSRQPEEGAPYRTAHVPPPERALAAEPDASWPLYLRNLVWLLCALVAWMAFLGWREHRLRAEIAALPVPTRAELFLHARDELRALCPAQPALRDHCAEQATFVLAFPDCDADCHALARRALDQARR